MEIPILYALAAPERLENEFRPFDPVAASPLEFEPVREEDFPMFRLGVDAGREGGTAPALYNAANEEAVRAFLEERLDFPGIPAVVERVLESADPGSAASLEGLHAADEEGRRRAREEIRRRGSGRGTRPVLGGATFADPDAGPEDAQERKRDT
jgi:1-deoxy-D-xylulose-5-phosphate reductoisomerase